jgi:hypothetical protein
MPRLIATAMTRIASVEVVLEFDVTARLGPSMRSVRLTLQGLPSTEDVLQSGNSLYVAAPGPPQGGGSQKPATQGEIIMNEDYAASSSLFTRGRRGRPPRYRRTPVHHERHASE